MNVPSPKLQPGSAHAPAGPASAPARRLFPVLAPVIIFATLAALFGFALRKGDPSKIPSALIGNPAPAFQLLGVPGIERAGAPLPGFSHTDLMSGKPSIVNFWASWCLPCADEHPVLVDLAKRAGVPLYGINHKDTPANARRFLDRYGNPFAAIGADANGRASIEWGVYGMPETFIVDGKGIVVFKHVGPMTNETLATQILPALKKAGAPVQ